MKQALLMCLLLIFFVDVMAQDIPFRTVTVEDGLSNNFVKTIFKDSRGFIWVGTLEGLDRFDGISFKPYMQHSGSVNAMIETLPNFLWVATEQGLWKLDYATEQLELVSLNGITGQVLSLAKDVNNRLLIGTNRGLFVVTETGMLHIQLDSSAVTSSSNNITGIEPSALYSCWIATSSSLFHCDYSSPQAKIDRFDASDPSVNVFSGIAKIGNSLYLGTKNKGLQKFDIQTKTFTPYIDIGNKFILKISGDGADRLLVGTDGSGLKEISVKSNTVISYTSSQDPLSIRSNAVYSFLETDGILWIGTYSAGLSYSLEKPFQVYSYGNSFPTRDKQIRSLNFNGSSSEKLLGTRDGFVYINEDRHIFNYFSANQQGGEALHSNLILSIYPFDGKFLIGTYGGGLSVFDPANQTIHAFRQEPVFSLGCFYDFSMDKNRNLWMATLEGVYCYHVSTEELTQFTIPDIPVSSNEVYSIRVDSKERIWVGMTQGLLYIDKLTSSIQPATQLQPSMKIDTKVTSIYEDKKANLWFCTEKDGLYMLSSDLQIYRHYSTEDFLPDNSVNSITEDGQGYYWIGLHKGLVRCSFIDSKFQLYGTSDGLPGLMFNPSAVYYDASDNKLWWGNENGLVYCTPDKVETTVVPPPIQLTGFRVGNEEMLPANEVRLAHSQNTLNIGFVILNYVYPNSNVFETFLDGHDKSWQTQAKGQTEVTYINLHPGEYTFHVRLTGFPETEKSLQIIIRRAWYAYLWIPAVLVGICVCGLWYRKRWRIVANSPGNLPDTSSEPKIKASKLPVKNGETIQQSLLLLVTEKKPYLNPDLKLPELASMLQCPPHDLSQILNDQFHQSFTDFINHYRVEEFKQLLHKDEHDKYTLTALSEQCGFSSRSSFFRIFKNTTGITPLEYLKQVENKRI